MELVIIMPTKPRPWPNVAKEARDRASEEAVHGIRLMEPLIGGEIKREEEIRRLAQINNCLNNIARILESVGAQTRPY